MSVWKTVGQSLGGTVRQAAQQVGDLPYEVLENAVGQGNENQGMEAVEQGNQTAAKQTQSDDVNNPQGFKTKEDFERYRELSGKKDDLETEQIRRRLQAEWGLATDVEQGMQQARVQYEQKEEQRKKAEEQEKEEKKMEDLQEKKQEEVALQAAKDASNPETQAWGAG